MIRGNEGIRDRDTSKKKGREKETVQMLHIYRDMDV